MDNISRAEEEQSEISFCSMDEDLNGSYHVILEGFPHFTHFKAIYKEFKTIGIEKLKVDIVENFPPHKTMAIVTFDHEESLLEAIKWDGKDFNHQPMYIRKLDVNNPADVEILNIVLHGKPKGNPSRPVNTRRPARGMRGAQRYPSSGHGFRPPPHGPPHHPPHQGPGPYMGPPGFRGPPPFRGRMGRPSLRARGPMRGHFVRGPPPPGAPYGRPPAPSPYGKPRGRGSYRGTPGRGGRGAFTRVISQSSTNGYEEPSQQDLEMSLHIHSMLQDCFPEGCLPWIAKDMPDEPVVHIAKVVNENYFFGHVTNGLPGVELKELTRKMDNRLLAIDSLDYSDVSEKRCGAWYSEQEGVQPELFRAWISRFFDDGTCHVFYIDWGNEKRVEMSELKSLQPIHWTLRPQIVLFRIDSTEGLEQGSQDKFKVLTRNVHEKNYVVPVQHVSGTETQMTF